MSIPPLPTLIRDRLARVAAYATTDGSALNTTSETTLFTLAIPSDIKAGDVLVWSAGGDQLNNSGGNVNYRYKFKLGGTTPHDSSTITWAASASRRIWQARGMIVAAATNDQRSVAELTVSSAGATGLAAASQALYGRGTAAEDLTAGKTLSMTMTLATAASTVDCVCHEASLAIIRRGV